MKKFIKKIKSHFWVLLLILSLLAVPVVTLAITSTNFEIIDGGTDASHHSSTSASFQLEGSVEPLVGWMNSTNFIQEAGSNLYGPYCGDTEIGPGEQCDGANLGGQTCGGLGFAAGVLFCNANCTFDTTFCTTGGGGGGGGGPYGEPPDTPTIDSSVLTVTYSSTELLFGTREEDGGVNVYVNDSSIGVTYPTSTTWQKLVTLGLGANVFEVHAENKYGESDPTEITITRLEKLYGDVNKDGVVNDYDLSILAYYWGTSYALVDFNSDGIVDDYDLSMMVAFWDIGA